MSQRESILKGKRILVVDDEPDLLTVLEEEILEACPTCRFDKASNYEQADERLRAEPYDVVILDIMGVRGFDLLSLAVKRNFPVAMLTAHALSPNALKRSMELGARAYLPKEKLGEIVPFLEDMLTYEYLPGWKRLLRKLEAFFNARWGPKWQQSELDFWREFEEKTEKGERAMAESILKGKKILAVDDEPDVLMVLEEEIHEACPDCKFDKATTYEDAVSKLNSTPYDVVILDIMGVKGFDLLDLAVSKKLRVAMLTAHALSPEALKLSFEKKARAYLPKEKLGEIVPFLEDVLKYEYLPGWKRVMDKLKTFFDAKFESDWEKKTGLDWQEWGKISRK